PETLPAAEPAAQTPTSFRAHWLVAALGIVLLANATIGTYIRNYITTYAIATLHMASNIAFAATVVNGLVGILAGLWGAILSDRFGRKPVMLIPGILLLAAIFPGFFIIAHHRSGIVLLTATGVLSALSSLSIIPMIAWLTESFPPAVRSQGVAVTYALSIATFGGTTQYAVAWLIDVTGSPLAPAWYWSVAAVFGVAAIIATRESTPHLIPLHNSEKVKN
ncbi:MAG TPA: MFS transporter, partial [Candidatus Acidoferrales bacterium]|nr:MFS transporter [Candidatus Acidoferrales bacterium]